VLKVPLNRNQSVSSGKMWSRCFKQIRIDGTVCGMCADIRRCLQVTVELRHSRRN